MPANGTTFPPLTPTVDPTAGEGGTISVDLLLRYPNRITRRLSNLLLQRLVASQVFGTGPQAGGGAVLYDQILFNDLYSNRDVQAIAAGSEFPIVDDGEVSTNVAQVTKRGGMVMLTYEAERRNDIDLLNRKLTRLTNTLARKIDTVCMAVLDTAIVASGRSVAAANVWSDQTNGNPIYDLTHAIATIDEADLNYTADTALYNPIQEVQLLNRADIALRLPREDRQLSTLLTGQIPAGFMGIRNWVKSNRVAAGSLYLMEAKTVGQVCDELPLYTRIIDEPKAETKYIQAARVCVPVITDPLAVVRITGLGAS